MCSISISHPLPHSLALALALAQALRLLKDTSVKFYLIIYVSHICKEEVMHVVIFQNLLNLRSAEVTLEQRPPPPFPNGPDSIHTHPDK